MSNNVASEMYSRVCKRRSLVLCLVAGIVFLLAPRCARSQTRQQLENATEGDVPKAASGNLSMKVQGPSETEG